jgi:quercetin dioxygenase-like cupin family protein
MRKIFFVLGVVLLGGIAFCLLHIQGASAQVDPTKMGTILQRTEIKGAPGMEAILVLRELPAGAASGEHTQSGGEIVYILDGEVTLEEKGKPPMTVKAGEAFTTAAGEVHNVKNTNAGGPSKALAFYIAKKGAKLEDLSIPVKP